MWRALLRKGRADLVGRPLTTLLLAVVIAVGAATLVMAVTVNRSASTSFEDFIEEAHAGHVWIFTSLERQQQIAATAGFAEAGEPMPAFDGGKLVGSVADHWLSYFGTGSERPAVAPALLTDGRWLTAGTNEAVVDRGFARSEGLNVGDTIRVTGRGGIVELQIVGLAIPTSRPSFPVWNYARVFVASEMVSTLGGGQPAYYAAGYRLEDPARAPAIVQSLNLRYRDSIGIRDWQQIRDSIVEENEPTFILLGSFAFFALIAAAFIIANSVTGQVQGQLRDIGLLKAIGMTPRQVTLLFVLELIVVGAVGGLVGALAGWWITPLFLHNVEELLGLPASVTPSPFAMAAAVVLATGLGALAALIAGWRAGGVAATAAVIGGARGTGGRPSRLAAIATKLHMPGIVVFGLKDLFGRPLRAWLTIAAVAVAAAAIVVTVTMEELLSNALTNPEVVGVLPIEFRLERVRAGDAGDQSPSLISDEEITSLVESYPEVERYITRRWVNVVIDAQTFTGLGVGGQIDRFNYPILEGRMFEQRGEAIVGLGLARWLGLSVGDKRLVHFFGPDGPERVMEIVGIYIEDENDGRSISFSLDEDLRRAAPGIDAGEYGIGVRDGTDLDAFAARLVEDADGRVTVMNFAAVMQSEVSGLRSTIRPILIALSGFLLVLVSVSLISSLTLSVRERTREIGVLKTIGFTPADILGSIVAGALALSLIGAVIGAPLGWLFTRFIVDEPFSSQGYDVNKIVPIPSFWWFVLVIFVMILVAIVGSSLPARHATRLRISEALRYE